MPDFTGYPIELERKEEIEDSSTDFMLAVQGLYSAPKRFDPREWMRTENQGQVGRCAGYGSATVAEQCFWIGTGGKVIQFSGHYSYIRTQGIDGLLGRDRGSTIAGQVKSAKQFGYCPQDSFGNEPENYTTDLPIGADDAASNFKIKSHSFIRTLDEWDTYLKSGQGALLIGASWGYWGPDSKGYVRKFKTGPRAGGHAWYSGGWQEDETYMALNSHGRGFGINGWMFLTPEFITSMLRDRWTVVVGMSDLSTPTPRPVDWVKDSINV